MPINDMPFDSAIAGSTVMLEFTGDFATQNLLSSSRMDNHKQWRFRRAVHGRRADSAGGMPRRHGSASAVTVGVPGDAAESA